MKGLSEVYLHFLSFRLHLARRGLNPHEKQTMWIGCSPSGHPTPLLCELRRIMWVSDSSRSQVTLLVSLVDQRGLGWKHSNSCQSQRRILGWMGLRSSHGSVSVDGRDWAWIPVVPLYPNEALWLPKSTALSYVVDAMMPSQEPLQHFRAMQPHDL